MPYMYFLIYSLKIQTRYIVLFPGNLRLRENSFFKLCNARDFPWSNKYNPVLYSAAKEKVISTDLTQMWLTQKPVFFSSSVQFSSIALLCLTL